MLTYLNIARFWRAYDDALRILRARYRVGDLSAAQYMLLRAELDRIAQPYRN